MHVSCYFFSGSQLVLPNIAFYRFYDISGVLFIIVFNIVLHDSVKEGCLVFFVLISWRLFCNLKRSELISR